MLCLAVHEIARALPEHPAHVAAVRDWAAVIECGFASGFALRGELSVSAVATLLAESELAPVMRELGAAPERARATMGITQDVGQEFSKLFAFDITRGDMPSLSSRAQTYDELLTWHAAGLALLEQFAKVHSRGAR